MFLSLLLVIVALWTGRSCGCTGNQRSEAADSKETDSTPKDDSIEESREDVASDSSTGCQFTAYGQKAAKETTAEIKYTKQHVTDGAENSNNNSGVKAPKSKDELFKEAKENNDYLTMKALADQGYVKAYIPLAQHYLKNKNTHGQAKEYAEKAQQASVPGANEILEELELLDY